MKKHGKTDTKDFSYYFDLIFQTFIDDVPMVLCGKPAVQSALHGVPRVTSLVGISTRCRLTPMPPQRSNSNFVVLMREMEDRVDEILFQKL